MIITDIPDVTEAPAGVAGDLDAVQGLLDAVRGTAVSGGTYVSATVNVHCPSTEAVDCAAAQWGTEAQWNRDGTQYYAQRGNYRIRLVAIYIPNALTVADPPEREASAPEAAADGDAAGDLVECVTCRRKFPPDQMNLNAMITYRTPGSLRGTPRPTCRDTQACTKRAIDAGRLS